MNFRNSNVKPSAKRIIMQERSENMNSSCEVSVTENLLRKLECPFTWAMEKITKELVYDEHYEDLDDTQYLPNEEQNDDNKENNPNSDMYDLFNLMRHIMIVYVDTKAKIDSKEILNKLEKCEDFMVNLKKCNHPEVSADIAFFILKSTRSFVFKELNLIKELHQTLDEINIDWKFNNKERGTLNACKSICWSLCNLPILEAEHFIRDAIKDNPNCEIWFYFFGKILRRKRRTSSFWSRPSREEIDSFLEAYNISATPAYGIFVAQAYREMKWYRDAEKMYNMIFEQTSSTKPTILLKLALGFIRIKNFTKAKVCLDKAEILLPRCKVMYMQYRGIYHYQLNEYKEAAHFFKKASNLSNRHVTSEKLYLECTMKLDDSFDIIGYLHGMVDKYKNSSTEQVQELLLDLALLYWQRKGDIENALIYFLKAIEKNPTSKHIVEYYRCNFVRIDENLIYKLLNKEILPLVLRHKEKFEQSCIDRAEDLQKYCDQYFSKRNLNVEIRYLKLN